MKFLQIHTRFFMGKRYLLLLLSVSPLILSGCDGAQKAATEYVAQQMRDPSSAKFRDVQTVTDSADPYVQNICGFVNGKNLFGAYTGEKRFVVEIFTGPQKSTFTPLRFIVEGDDDHLVGPRRDRTKLLIRKHFSKNNTGTNAVSPISVNLHILVLAGKHPLSFAERRYSHH